jgi:hypothetical protein
MAQDLHHSMSTMKRILSAAIFLAFAGGGFAATPSRHDVLIAISVLEKNVTGPEATEAAKTVVVYAQDSDDVLVDIGPEQLPWTNEKWGLDQEQELAFQSVLLASFVAGNIRSQIKNSRAEDDTYSGWIFAINTYKRLRADGSFRSPSIEALLKMEADGTLLQHAREVRSKEENEDPSDAPPAPVALGAASKRAPA